MVLVKNGHVYEGDSFQSNFPEMWSFVESDIFWAFYWSLPLQDLPHAGS